MTVSLVATLLSQACASKRTVGPLFDMVCLKGLVRSRAKKPTPGRICGLEAISKTSSEQDNETS